MGMNPFHESEKERDSARNCAKWYPSKAPRRLEAAKRLKNRAQRSWDNLQTKCIAYLPVEYGASHSFGPGMCVFPLVSKTPKQPSFVKIQNSQQLLPDHVDVFDVHYPLCGRWRTAESDGSLKMVVQNAESFKTMYTLIIPLHDVSAHRRVQRKRLVCDTRMILFALCNRSAL